MARSRVTAVERREEPQGGDIGGVSRVKKSRRADIEVPPPSQVGCADRVRWPKNFSAMSGAIPSDAVTASAVIDTSILAGDDGGAAAASSPRAALCRWNIATDCIARSDAREECAPHGRWWRSFRASRWSATACDGDDIRGCARWDRRSFWRGNLGGVHCSCGRRCACVQCCRVGKKGYYSLILVSPRIHSRGLVCCKPSVGLPCTSCFRCWSAVRIRNA